MMNKHPHIKIVVAPDSFKGGLSASQAADAIERGLLQSGIEALEIVKVPLADGGEGTVEAIIRAAGGTVVRRVVTGPLGASVEAGFGLLPDGKTALIELPAASGLTLVPPVLRNPLITTTYGTGELMREALDLGCTRLIIGLGGSATNDGGMGIAQALGVRFFDAEGGLLGQGGGQMKRVASIEFTSLDPRVPETDISVLCDVRNPLYGPEGAAFVFAPQKGATPEMVTELDEGLRNLANVVKTATRKEMNVAGAGAAGGAGGGLLVFLNAELKPGFPTLAEIVGLDKVLQDASLVITGEGRTDSQTVYGKVPSGVAALAKKYGVPAVCLSGSLGPGYENLYEAGMTALFSILEGPAALEEAIANAEELVSRSAANAARLCFHAYL